MSIGFGLLFLFVSFSINQKLIGVGKCQKFIIICISILCPILSSASAFGLLTWFKFQIYTIMCVSPFLICGIGNLILLKIN